MATTIGINTTAQTRTTKPTAGPKAKAEPSHTARPARGLGARATAALLSAAEAMLDARESFGDANAALNRATEAWDDDAAEESRSRWEEAEGRWSVASDAYWKAAETLASLMARHGQEIVIVESRGVVVFDAIVPDDEREPAEVSYEYAIVFKVVPLRAAAMMRPM